MLRQAQHEGNCLLNLNAVARCSIARCAGVVFVIPATGGIQAILQRAPKMKLAAGLRGHDGSYLRLHARDLNHLRQSHQ